MLRFVIPLAMIAMPAAAQEQQPRTMGAAVAQAERETGTTPQRIRSVTLTGGQACPKSTGDEIVVCSRLNPDEQFRIPKQLRNTAEPAARNQAWANRARVADTVGRQAAGLPDSCSPVGSGGQTGCSMAWNREYAAEKRAAQSNDAMVP